MNEIDEYIKAKGITLTSSQSSQVLHLLNIYRITDFDSVCERAKKVFTGKTIKKHDGNVTGHLLNARCVDVCVVVIRRLSLNTFEAISINSRHLLRE